MTNVNNGKRRKPPHDVCKPCWELKYCPYGALVEQAPLPYEGVTVDFIEERFRSLLADFAEGKYKSPAEIVMMAERLHFYMPWKWRAIEGYDTSEMECYAFGHVCPMFFMAEPETETIETRRRGHYIPRDIMLKVVRRDGQICQECNKHVLDQELEFDHIIPHSKGGPVSVENLRVLCSDCNKKKSNSLSKLLRAKPNKQA